MYDEDIATNKFNAISLIIGTCQKILHVFGEENCDSLRQNCVNRAAKLLKKPDQCRAVALCSNLFWNCKQRKDGVSVIELNFLSHLTTLNNSIGTFYRFKLRDNQKVIDCLKKCLKIAAQCVDLNAQFELHVEILNYFLFYFEAKNENVRNDFYLYLRYFLLAAVKFN